MPERQSPSALRTGDYGTMREAVRSFTTYDEAERAVGYLVRQDFPIEPVAVIGPRPVGGGANHRSARIRATDPARGLGRRGDRAAHRLGVRLVRLDLTADRERAARPGRADLRVAVGALLELVSDAVQRGRRDFASVRTVRPGH